ncbi:MAG: 7-carboxy-7-deazaguanine synthase QueE [Deltaproteobacteria bacterium]|nr:7-carboxy-7-deazaguanine synthase QueE [Deltaproteobacteria bacterium]
MRIAEIFYSIQGEGRLVGVPSVFVRTSGCNLRCIWCDTPYTSWRPTGREWSLSEILKEISKYPARHVVVTGGEPFIAPELGKLTAALKRRGKHITIETAATIFKVVDCDLISLSPKLANSTPWKKQRGKFAAMHEARRSNLEVLQQFVDGYDYQLKFVVQQAEDFSEIRTLIRMLRSVDPTRVLLMPEGNRRDELRQKSAWIVELCKKTGYGFTPRLHIELFGNRRGT